MKRNIRWLRNRRGIILTFIVVISLPFLIVFESNSIIRQRYEITELENKIKEEEIKNRNLRIEIEGLSSPSRIEALAGSIGLISARPSQIVFMKDVEEEAPVEKMDQQTFLAKLFEVFAKER